MQYITQGEIQTRIDDIFRNSLTLNGDGKIGLRPISPEGEYWMIMWTHILEEMVLRGKGLPHGNLLSPETIPKATWPETPDAAIVLRGKKYKEGYHLFKYGNKLHLKGMHENGAIRIAPASSYKDSSLNSAINDDEKVLSVFDHPDKVKISHVDKITGKKTIIKPKGNVKRTLELPTNYYVYSMAYVYDYRLFDDFEYNACIVIHDTKKFLLLLDKAFKQSIGNWVFVTNPVHYIDPLNPPNEKDIDLFFCKHFKYSYQKEIRAVWLPESYIEELEPVYLDIGCMGSYADYIEF